MTDNSRPCELCENEDYSCSFEPCRSCYMDRGHPNWEPIAYPRGFPVIVPEMLDVTASQPETNDPQPEGKNT